MSLDDYTKSKVIGKGSYGEVWAVKHKRDKKQYVLKKMSLQNASKRERKAAEQEAKLLAKLKHPNIVSYKDSFETDDGFLYIAMGLCEGGDLYNRLKEQKNAPLEETQVVEWFVQIAMALQYMHERNILHRDLKTQNIFLTKSKIIKVGDLGIARVLDNSNDMATTLIGTPYYMSPELFSNKPYNHKSDVWALGCCVYEMATLRHAFNAKDMNSLVYKILRGKMPMMPRQYSGDLVNLIKAMLNANPDRRPNVNRILRDPYIKKNIALFLEGTRKKVNNSKRTQSTSSDEGQVNSSRSSVSSVSSVGNVVKPKKVDQPRPLPPGPSPNGGDDAMPVSSRSRRRGSAQDSGYKSHESSAQSQDQNEAETPRQSVNKSARARRREKVELETPRTARSVDIERPSSARPSSARASSDHAHRRHAELEAQGDKHLRPNSARSTPSGARHELGAGGDRPARPSSAKSVPGESRQERYNIFKSQPSVDDDSSDEMEEIQDKSARRQHKEMNNFISLLDHTLNLKKDDKSDEDSEAKQLEEIEEADEESQSARPKTGGSVTYAVKNPKVVKSAEDVDMPDFDPRPRHQNPGKALGSSTRLMDRIGALRKDCIRGLGVLKLKKAYDILDNIEGDELENALVDLLGRDDFEIYAGKIWQLKFCEEAAFGISS